MWLDNIVIKPNIILTANTSWYIHNFRKNLIESLLNDGYNPIILAPDDSYSGYFHVEYHNIKIKSQSKNLISDIVLLTDYLRLYRKLKPDLVLNFTLKPNLYSTIAASINKIPVINNITGLGDVFTEGSIINKIVGYLYRFSQPRADFIFFQNREDMKVFSNWGILKTDKYDLLPGSGVDTEWFYFSDLPEREKFIFLFLGRLLKKKGVNEYVKAAEILNQEFKNTEFQILGFPDVDNPGSISLSEVEEWQDQGIISFLGQTEDVRSYIKKADCIVLPSYYREGVPRSLLEALSMGRPIITTDNTGCRDVVDNDVNGFICLPADIQSLVEVMKKMMELPYSDRANMGFRGREKALHFFDEKTVINKYLSIIKRII